MIKINLKGIAYQRFSLSINSVRYHFEFVYNTFIERYMMSVESGDTRLISGVIVGAQFDLLSDSTAGRSIGKIIAIDLNGEKRPPTLENIEAGAVSIFISPAAAGADT